MKTWLRILCALLCVALICGMPFYMSAPMMIQGAKDTLLNEDEEEDEGESLDFGRLLFPSAAAEEEFVMEETDAEDPFAEKTSESVSGGNLSIPDAWKLPFDFSVPPMPDPEKFNENGYEDASIRVTVETLEVMESTVLVPSRCSTSQSKTTR